MRRVETWRGEEPVKFGETSNNEASPLDLTSLSSSHFTVVVPHCVCAGVLVCAVGR